MSASLQASVSAKKANQRQDRTSSYRSDIDGLRAIAVGFVVLFHLEIPRIANGGFIGVDVFFVISGYLITGILHREISRGSFTFLGFYERRIRRILPALIAMLAVTSLASYFLLVPADLLRFANSLLASVFSYSNIYFWTQAGYFKQTYVKLLLHTWSLSVEEQFYMVFPVTLFILSKKPRLLPYALITLGLCSLVVSEWLALKYPESAFYLPQSRAWELLLGSILAVGIVPPLKARFAREVLALIGVSSILFAAILYTHNTPFPGVAALVPCIGCALVIWAGERGPLSFVGRLLSLQPVVFLGMISYSLYLWHWPLILCVRMGAVAGLSLGDSPHKILVGLVSIPIAWVSWKYVEQPFRATRSNTLSRKTIFIFAGAAASVVVTIAAVLALSRGLPYRFSPKALAVAAFLDQNDQMRQGACFLETSSRFQDYDQSQCATVKPDVPNYLLVGDSHAAALWFGLSKELGNVNILQATSAGCKALPGDREGGICGSMQDFIYKSFLPSHHVDGVIFTERWRHLADIDRFAYSLGWFKEKGIPVLAVGPVEEYDVPLPMLLAFSLQRHQPDFPQTHLIPRTQELDTCLSQRMKEVGVPYVSPWAALCGGEVCRNYVDDTDSPVLTDGDHLSKEASVALVRQWKESAAFTSFFAHGFGPTVTRPIKRE